ncbi:MAG: hypothetical protein HY005_03000 [Candidatus Staskawiczbacteria bacterium]|nr:hypothetical protein [Candidatus Staskawiczbacteria bacterium]MBI3337561.1 hypothetical protein [Candidatus Staskawiczbacteria bacterium]
MAKKIFDILPPKIAHKVEHGVKSLAKGEEKHSNGRVNKKHSKGLGSHKRRRFPLREVLSVSCILFLILAGVLYFKLQKVNVEIWPKTEILNFKEQVMADNSADTIDYGSKTIPAQYLNEEKDLWQEFSATGNASNDGKAEGLIVIYNSYSPASDITLKIGTHFLSDSGKYFITLQRVVVPAAKKQNNKTIPGSIEVKVQATDPGEEYNIKPAKFSVPKLVGTPYYYSIYAESSNAMTGGFSSTIKKVTEDDIKIAKNILQKNLLNNIQESLKGKISSEYILLDKSIFSEITESASAVKAGAVVDKFGYQAKARATALFFKKSDMENFIKEYINSNVSYQKTLLEDSLTVNYNPETIDIKDKKIVINLDFSVKTYQSVDKNDLIALFREKSSDEIKETINNRMGDSISRVKVNLWPFWTTKAPRDQNKIKIDLKFE